MGGCCSATARQWDGDWEMGGGEARAEGGGGA